MTLTLPILNAQAITTNIVDGLTPPALRRGAPPGTQEISKLERINLYNGQLSVAIPLLTVSARGEASFTMYARLESRPWTVDVSTARYCPSGNNCTSEYTHQSGATNGELDPFDSPYSPGVVYLKRQTKFPLYCGASDTFGFTSTFSHIVFQRPDGTQVDLWDGSSPASAGCSGSSGLRGPTFRSTDESGIVFVAKDDLKFADLSSALDQDKVSVSGKLLFPNGTTYTVDHGRITRITDRNGNYIEFRYSGTSLLLTAVEDSSGRTVNIAHDTTEQAEPGYGRFDKITYNGAGGAPREIRVRRLRTGTLTPFIRAGLPTTITGGNMGFSGSFDKWITDIRLPDRRTYEFRYTAFGELAAMKLPSGAAIEYDHAAGLSNAGEIRGTYENGQILDNQSIGGVAYRTSDTQVPWRPAVYRRLVERRTYPSGGEGASFESKTTYSRRESASLKNPPPAAGAPVDALDITSQPYIEVRETGANLATDIVSRHHFQEAAELLMASPARAVFGSVRYLTEQPALEGRQYRTEVVDVTSLQTVPGPGYPAVFPSGAPALRTTEEAYEVTAGRAVETCQITRFDGPSKTLRAETLFSYDSYGNVTHRHEYGYDIGPETGKGGASNNIPTSCAAATPSYTRQTQTSYVTDSTYTALDAHLWSLPLTETVHSAGGTIATQTSYEYDRRALIDTEGPAWQLDSDTVRTVRGNATAIRRSAGARTLTTSNQYDLAGNLRRVVAPTASAPESTAPLQDHARARKISYADSCDSGPGRRGLLQVTQVELPPASGSTRMSYSTRHDCWLGQPTLFKDVNGVETAFTYEAAHSYSADTAAKMDRLIKVVRAPGKDEQSETEYGYGNTVPNVFVKETSSKDTHDDQGMQSETLYDGFGRVTQEKRWDGSAWIATKTEYDAAGRARRVSHPTSGTFQWTTTEHDALGRPVSVKTPDNAVTSFQYAGNATLVQDPAGIRKITVADALGRLQKVIENPRAATGQETVADLVASPGAAATTTLYGYDGADRLEMVCPQGGTLSGGPGTYACSGTNLYRKFTYDLLGRVKTTRNPESSDITYSYDEVESTNGEGNLTSRSQNRGVAAATVATRYHYDGLNRLTQIVYDGTPDSIATPTVTYSYDAHTPSTGATSYPKGRLTRVEVAGGTVTAYESFDALGRITRSQQTTGGEMYRFGDETNAGYEYFANGALKKMRYPSGRTITMAYDAFARPTSVAAGTKQYVTSATYADHGPLAVLRLNGQRTRETHTWDAQRLQLTEVKVENCVDNAAACASAVEQLGMAYSYTAAGVGNNGNPRSQTIRAGGGFTAQQVYDYDGWNRLWRFQEKLLVSGTYTDKLDETYCYDAHGNRAVLVRPDLLSRTPKVTQCTEAAVQAIFPSNRVAGLTYDASGAVGYDDGSNLRWDAEGRLRKSWLEVATVTEYEYDGQGHRVVKKTGSAAGTTYVYDAFGNLAAEYGGNSDLAGTSPHYVHVDGLGSTRLVTDGTGAVERRSDYWPFGAEINGLVSNEAPYRTGALKYAANSDPRQKFTGKERDAETGLDYFGARYYSGVQGRFTSPDPNQAGASLFDPQSWNVYSYVNNRPLTHVDPDGDVAINVIAAGVGAAAGGIVGGGFEAWKQYRRDGRITSWGKVGTAAGGGAIAGGISGFTLGIGSAAGVAATTTEVVLVNASSSVIGGIAQRSADEMLGLAGQSDYQTELADIAYDAVTSGVFSSAGAKVADKLAPIPNVAQEIRELQFAHRRSTRGARIETARTNAKLQAGFNSLVGGVVAGVPSESSKWLAQSRRMWQWMVSKLSRPKEVTSQVCYANGHCEGGGH